MLITTAPAKSISIYTTFALILKKIRKTKANMDMLINTPQVNDWWWIDAIQMGDADICQNGKTYGRTEIL